MGERNRPKGIDTHTPFPKKRNNLIEGSVEGEHVEGRNVGNNQRCTGCERVQNGEKKIKKTNHTLCSCITAPRFIK